MHDKMNTPDLCSISIEKIEEAFNTGRITIAVIGTGHIGLLLACHFAQANANVLGVDINPDVVNKISRGKSPFFELKSEKLIGDNVANGRLKATTNLSTALNKANVVVTPGSAFGNYGEGYFRISITLADSRLEEALERIKKIL